MLFLIYFFTDKLLLGRIYGIDSCDWISRIDFWKFTVNLILLNLRVRVDVSPSVYLTGGGDYSVGVRDIDGLDRV